MTERDTGSSKVDSHARGRGYAKRVSYLSYRHALAEIAKPTGCPRHSRSTKPGETLTAVVAPKPSRFYKPKAMGNGAVRSRGLAPMNRK